MSAGPAVDVDVNQAAELTGLTRDAIRARIRRRALTAQNRDGRHRIPVAELKEQGLVVPGDRYRALRERVAALESQLRAAADDRDRAERKLADYRAQRERVSALESELDAVADDRERAEQKLAESATKLRVVLGAQKLEQSRAAERAESRARRRRWYVPWTWRHGGDGEESSRRGRPLGPR